MHNRLWLVAVLLGGLFSMPAQSQERSSASAMYQALSCPLPSAGSTWGILQRDGANRQVAPYLSSLVQGESGTGVITSRPFKIASDTITFTIRGHDGQGGGGGKNFIALVDARKGKTLKKTPAPGNDALQERTWDVSDLGGVEVRIEVHDGDGGGAFAWLGIGTINAGEARNVDFSKGMPRGWQRSQREAAAQFEFLTGGIPFKQNTAIYSLIPAKGAVEIPCGFSAKRIFLLGCTVSRGRPLACYGGVEIHYQTGAVDIIPLVYGFTLDGQDKLLSPSRAIHLHRSSDPFQHYLAITPRDDPIASIRLVANPSKGPIPRITAITCETTATSDRLSALPSKPLPAKEATWIQSHAVSPREPAFETIEAELRRAHKMPPAEQSSVVRFRKHRLDSAFRSEGVAVADFNGDGRLDIATGNQIYLGPDWKIQPMQGEPKAFKLKGYSDSFLCFDDDVDRDGDTDLIVVGFPGQQTRWMENPGKVGAKWTPHLAVKATGNESPDFVDLFGDGRRSLLFMNGNRCALASPSQDPTDVWTIREIAGPGDPGAVHGLGVGDVNGDGHQDTLCPGGWWEGPARHTSKPWKFHKAPLYGGAQMCVWDFDGDGDNDVLGSSAHGYGIAWTEQKKGGWETHLIDDSDSQTHAIRLADINGDGLMDFVTGKRFWAHNGHDPGSYEPAVLCWYELRRDGGRPVWIKHQIDHDSGVGLHFQIIDVNGDKLLDVVTANKKGVFYFEQLPRAHRNLGGR